MRYADDARDARKVRAERRNGRAPRVDDWEDGPETPEDWLSLPRWAWPENALVVLDGAGRPLGVLGAGLGE